LFACRFHHFPVRSARKGFGITAALVCLITYFLLTFAGEQLARSGTIGVILGGLLPVFAVIAAILWLNLAPRGEMFRDLSARSEKLSTALGAARERWVRRNAFIDITTGIRDFDLLSTYLSTFY
jgi:hypothetical protein